MTICQVIVVCVDTYIHKYISCVRSETEKQVRANLPYTARGGESHLRTDVWPKANRAGRTHAPRTRTTTQRICLRVTPNKSPTPRNKSCPRCQQLRRNHCSNKMEIFRRSRRRRSKARRRWSRRRFNPP